MLLDTSGSYIREPSVSEASLGQAVHELSESIAPNHATEIKWSFHLKQGEAPALDLLRIHKEFSAAFGHTIADEVTIHSKFTSGDAQWKASKLDFSLSGTRDSRGCIELVDGEYDTYLRDTETDSIIPRGVTPDSVISQLLEFLNADLAPDLSTQRAFRNWLITQFTPGQTLDATQYHILRDYAGDKGELIGTRELVRSIIFSDSEITNVTEFVETILVDGDNFARVLQLVESDSGTSLSLKEIHEHDGQVTIHTPEPDYAMIDRMTRHVREQTLSAT